MLPDAVRAEQGNPILAIRDAVFQVLRRQATPRRIRSRRPSETRWEPSPHPSYPCTKSGAFKSATTGADGTFVFSDVPIGSYGLTYKAHTKWTITLGNRYCQNMKAGSTCKIPNLDVNR